MLYSTPRLSTFSRIYVHTYNFEIIFKPWSKWFTTQCLTSIGDLQANEDVITEHMYTSYRWLRSIFKFKPKQLGAQKHFAANFLLWRHFANISHLLFSNKYWFDSVILSFSFKHRQRDLLPAFLDGAHLTIDHETLNVCPVPWVATHI